MCGIAAIAVILISLSHGPARPADGDFTDAVLKITGSTSLEELSEEEMERYSGLYASPVRLNYATRSRLLSCGLFSAYQVAVLADYRERSGDILSFEELSALDGFGHGFVSAIEPFVSVASRASPGVSSAETGRVRNDLTLKSGLKNNSDPFLLQGTYSMKYKVSAGERLESGISLKSAYQGRHFPPETYSFFFAWYGRQWPVKVIAGDYSLRFGQGLALWSGFSLSGATSPETAARRPSGISPYNSYSGEGAFRGVAADAAFRHITFSAFISSPWLRSAMEGEEDVLPRIVYGANAGWYGMPGQVSLTCIAESVLFPDSAYSAVEEGHGCGPCPDVKCSADARFSVAGTDLFSEIAYDFAGKSVAALAGAMVDFGESVQMAVVARYYPPDYRPGYSGAARGGSKCCNEHGVSFSMSHSSGGWVEINGRTGFGSSERRFNGIFSTDAFYSPEPRYGTDTSSFQLKLQLAESIRISPAVALSMRMSGRFRTYGQPLRSDVRADIECSFMRWSVNARVNVLHCEDFSFLSYVEAGYEDDCGSVWLRTGCFFADRWNDRIYAYERDAPGNFSVPAYYGRGYWLALTSGLRLSRSFRLYLRASFQDYPWLAAGAEPKPCRAELKLQLTVRL